MESLLPVPEHLQWFEGAKVRTFYGPKGEPIWHAQDVCDVLGIVNARDAVSRLKDSQKITVGIADSSGRPHKTWCLREGGLYKLVLTSRKAEAERFQDWITDEVLPSIRKTGSYRLTTRRLVENLADPVMIQNSKDVASVNHAQGGVPAIIGWYMRSTQEIRGLSTVTIKAAGKVAGLPSNVTKSARAVLRALPGERAYAAAISAADDLHIVGHSDDMSIEGGKQALPFFDWCAVNGITAPEALESPYDRKGA